MSGRSKLLLGSVGFLGANGAIIPVLNNNYGIFDSLSSSIFGGGIT
ncbi:hypothetical protein OVS_04200 [Mycoplasma ovis str. Michigan]|uniref:MFS transporter n=1 Tax=Mycoplasma ovis str. Michigan TaxID=1415773 RepID=A0ABM5P2I4_9MOLU|nr:hypothetical protein [Mycoplasma ovis]AHC40567.1 hypothetical protein OVS_04200 [Mycoplasma ovis str. Michigan]